MLTPVGEPFFVALLIAGFRNWVANASSQLKVVSATLLLMSAFRIIRFHWLLRLNSRVHRELSEGLSADVARQLGLRKRPNIVVTTASNDVRLVIAHEMAHIKRRDHWLRWLEWIALIGLWWNPVMWWARNQLRISEEMACDDLVLESAAPDVHQYANSLLNMAELLAAPAIRPPVVASAINSGGRLEKRLKMMIAEKSWKVPSAVRMTIVAIATCVFPLGVVYAQDLEAVERRLGGAVEAGELSLQQANLMMEALKRSAGIDHSDREMEAKKRRYMEFMREIEAAVKDGKMSKEDAEKKLIAVRKEVFRNPGEQKARDNESVDREMEAKKRRYMEFARKIEVAVKEGELSKEDAKKKLIAVRREMFEETPRRDNRGLSVEDYRRAEAQIREAVEKGEVSKEDAEMRLIEMRKMIHSEKSEGDNNRSREPTDGNSR